MKIPRVGDYMSRAPHVIDRGRSVREAAEVMRNNVIRHLPVVDGQRLVGIVSARDVRLVEASSDVSIDQIHVDWAIGAAPYVVTPATPLEEAAQLMAEKKCDAVAVVEEGCVVGVLTTIDALGALAELLRVRASPARARRRERRIARP